MVSTFEKYITGDTNDGQNLDTSTVADAQTFTIGTVGTNLDFNISSVDVLILNEAGPTSAIKAGIYETLPDGSPDFKSSSKIAEGEGSMTTVGANSWLNIPMTTIGTLKRSTKYIVVFQEGSGNDSSINPRYNVTGAYAGGNRYTSTDSGATWTSQAAHDILFQINGGNYNGTLCTLADAVNKAGAGANATAKNESLVSDFVRQAEGKIAAVSRHDWVGAYSGLSDDVKFILNETASEIAAIKIITYDMSGYTDRVEAETMINVYRENIALNLSLLKDKQVQTFIEKDT